MKLCMVKCALCYFFMGPFRTPEMGRILRWRRNLKGRCEGENNTKAKYIHRASMAANCSEGEGWVARGTMPALLEAEGFIIRGFLLPRHGAAASGSLCPARVSGLAEQSRCRWEDAPSRAEAERGYGACLGGGGLPNQNGVLRCTAGTRRDRASQ